MRGRVAGTFMGMVALFIAVPAHAAAARCRPIRSCSRDSSRRRRPRLGGGIGSTPAGAPTGRPVLTLFNVSPSAVAPTAGGTVVRFQVRDRARSVRVRLAFVSLADRTTYRVNLGSRRTGRRAHLRLDA